MRAEPASPSHLVLPLVRLCRSRGAALELAGLGLPAEPLEDTPITARGLGRLFDAVAEALDEPHLGLTLPGALPFSRYELPELAARSSPTLREGMQRLTRYAPLLNDGVEFALEEENGLARFIQRTVGYPRGVSRHLNEFAMAMAVHSCRTQTGRWLTVREVRFMNARPGGALDTLRTYFRTGALRFGHAENTLVFDAAVLDAPQATHDPRLLATAEGLAQAELTRRGPKTEGFAMRVERKLRECLEHGEPSMRAVAQGLKMSTRTLQRRLEAEGKGFAQVLDQVREALARTLVAEREPSLSEVAFQLGFAEFATFSRAFKRWTGSAPGAFRDGHR
jgi:AraC-like DNA-binding protein